MRLKKKDRIIKYALDKGYNTPVINLLSAILEISENGVVLNYFPKVHNELIQSLFNSDSGQYNAAYLQLVKDKIIELRSLNLIIPIWEDDQYYIQKYNSPKRKYSKDSYKEQQTLNELLLTLNDSINRSKRPDEINIEKALHPGDEPINISLNWAKITGIKVPRSLECLFTERFSNEDHARYFIEEDKPVTKEMKRYICGLLAQVNSEGEIRDYNQWNSIKQMMKLFDDNSLKESTCYYVHDRLARMKVFEVIEVKGEKRFRFNWYKEGFGKGRNYIIIPYAVFQRAFKELQASAIKVFFEVIFQLNNGETDGAKNLGKDKAIYFKLFTTKHDTKDRKEKYVVSVLRWLKKRCKSEVIELFYRKSKQSRTTLEDFFDIGFNKKNEQYGIIEIRIKQVYYVSKKEKKIYLKGDPLERYPKRAEYIKELLNKTPIKYTEDELRQIVITFKKADKRTIETLIRALELDYKIRKEHRWKDIENIVKYLRWLYKQYREGDRAIIKNKLAGKPSDDIPDMYDKEPYEEMDDEEGTA